MVKEHINENFKPWIFSDEAAFELRNCSAPTNVLVRREAHEKLGKHCIVDANVGRRPKIMVWGCILSTGLNKLVEGNLNSEKYLNLLKHDLEPLFDEIPLSMLRSVKFQYDNAPPHRSHKVTEYFVENKFQYHHGLQ